MSTWRDVARLSDIQPGPLVEEAVFNYVPVSQALDALAEKAGYVWYIDFDHSLNFRPRSMHTAPWTVTDVDIRDISLEHGNPLYRNTQYIRGGTDITDVQTEETRGDGITTAFPMGFRVAKVPTVRVNGVEQTVGIRGLETGKQWYWSKGESIISQDNDGTPLTSSDTLSVTYQGEFSVVVISRSDSEIIRRQSIEQNSGINEDVADEPQTTTREAAFQSANAKIERYGVIGRKLRFRTRRKGLEAGQVATINLPEHGLSGVEMLIESVAISDESNTFWHDVTAIEGPEQGTWTRMFERLFAQADSLVVRENIAEDEILITLAGFSKVWNEPERPNIFVEVYANDTLFPSETLFPMFDFDDRVKSIAIYDLFGFELLRKSNTKQIGASSGEIVTTTYVAPFEAIGDIRKIVWYGGLRGNIIVDEQMYSKQKTDIEALQIEKTDTRNFTSAAGSWKLTPAYFQTLDDRIESLLAKSI